MSFCSEIGIFYCNADNSLMLLWVRFITCSYYHMRRIWCYTGASLKTKNPQLLESHTSRFFQSFCIFVIVAYSCSNPYCGLEVEHMTSDLRSWVQIPPSISFVHELHNPAWLKQNCSFHNWAKINKHKLMTEIFLLSCTIKTCVYASF